MLKFVVFIRVGDIAAGRDVEIMDLDVAGQDRGNMPGIALVTPS